MPRRQSPELLPVAWLSVSRRQRLEGRRPDNRALLCRREKPVIDWARATTSLAVPVPGPAVCLGVQFGRRDDDRGREEPGKLLRGVEQGSYALGVLGEIAGVVAGGWLVVHPRRGAL